MIPNRRSAKRKVAELLDKDAAKWGDNDSLAGGLCDASLDDAPVAFVIYEHEGAAAHLAAVFFEEGIEAFTIFFGLWIQEGLRLFKPRFVKWRA